MTAITMTSSARVNPREFKTRRDGVVGLPNLWGPLIRTIAHRSLGACTTRCLHDCRHDNLTAASQVPTEGRTVRVGHFAHVRSPFRTILARYGRCLPTPGVSGGRRGSRLTPIVGGRRPELSPPGFRPTIGDQRDQGVRPSGGTGERTATAEPRNTWSTPSASVSGVNGFAMLSQLRALHQPHHHIRDQQASHQLVSAQAPRLENGKRVYRKSS
jgi:hypothetical protein